MIKLGWSLSPWSTNPVEFPLAALRQTRKKSVPLNRYSHSSKLFLVGRIKSKYYLIMLWSLGHSNWEYLVIKEVWDECVSVDFGNCKTRSVLHRLSVNPCGSGHLPFHVSWAGNSRMFHKQPMHSSILWGDTIYSYSGDCDRNFYHFSKDLRVKSEVFFYWL